jgi:hypothetical protein
MTRCRTAFALAITLLLSMMALTGPVSAQGASTYVCTARDDSRMAGFVSQLFNVSQAEAAKVTQAWIAAIKMYGVTPSTPPTCQGFAKFAGADSARKQFIAFVTNSLEQRIDKMNWTYAGAPVATGDAPAAAASAPPVSGVNAAGQRVMSEAKAYCVQNHSAMYDCDGYAKAVYDHRQAHPGEVITDVDGTRIVPIHDLEVGIKYHLDCTSCLNDEMLGSWARQSVRQQFSAAVIAKALTQPKVDVYADCVAKAFVPKMHAKPNVEDYLKNFNEASVGCGSPH